VKEIGVLIGSCHLRVHVFYNSLDGILDMLQQDVIGFAMPEFVSL
jgi:hypothetical protein